MARSERREARSPESEPVESAAARGATGATFEASERGVDRTEGDVRPDAQSITQLGADLVAVVIPVHE